MDDIVVTVPKIDWEYWLSEGSQAGEPDSGAGYVFTTSVVAPELCVPGTRVYIVAHGRLRGYAPLVGAVHGLGVTGLLRAGGAQAVTVPCHWWLSHGATPRDIDKIGAWPAVNYAVNYAALPWCTPPNHCRRYPSHYGHIRGFRGWRRRWWPQEIEVPYPDWQRP